MVGIPIVARGCWSEHSERAVPPTGLSLKPMPPADRDMLGEMQARRAGYKPSSLRRLEHRIERRSSGRSRLRLEAGYFAQGS